MFASVEKLLSSARELPLWQAILTDDARDRGVSEQHSWEQMAKLWAAMKAAGPGDPPHPPDAPRQGGGAGPGLRPGPPFGQRTGGGRRRQG